MYPEVILVSYRVRKENFTPYGERLSPAERRVQEGRPPRLTGQWNGTSQNRLKIHPEMLNFPKGALMVDDRHKLRFMMEKEYSLHNLNPNCKNCIQCDICYFPNRVRSRVTEGRIKHFMDEIKLVPKEDGTQMFECKFIFNDKIHELKDNRDYVMHRAKKMEEQLIMSWANSLTQLNQTMDIGLRKKRWQFLSRKRKEIGTIFLLHSWEREMTQSA